MGSPFRMLLVMELIGATARPCRRIAQLLAVVTLIFAAGGPAGAEAPRLGLPVACEPNKTCFIQHYVDVAPQAGTQDFRCGHSTYKGHDGVDFRVLSAAAARQGIAVIAAAAGVVKGRRDGMADAFPREVGRDAIKNRECGNGVVIDHGDGWETQYCHMRQGSVKVSAGQKVERGTALGDVGYSGLADSAHLHLTVRHNGKPVDPFTSRTPDGTCLREGAETIALFEDSVVGAFPYADGIFLQTGFAARPLTWTELELDHTSGQHVVPQSDALVFFARLAHLRGGDRIQLTIKGPNGFAAVLPGEPVDRDKAIYIAQVGKKRIGTAPWATGDYEGEALLIRDGVAVRTARATFTMP